MVAIGFGGWRDLEGGDEGKVGDSKIRKSIM